MRRFPAVIPTLILVTLAGWLIACGGGGRRSDGKTGVPTSISLAVTSVSLNAGNFSAISATVLDGNGTPVNPAATPVQLTFASSNPTFASLTPATVSGATAIATVCAGGWDPGFIVCSPPPNGQVGTAQVTIKGMGLTSAPISVFVHQRVDRILVSPASVDCKSQGETQQFSAQAFGNGVDLTSTVGPFTWSADTTGVVTLDNSTHIGLATASSPGKTNIFASLTGTNSVNSTPATFVTCPVESLSMHVANGTETSVTLNNPGQQAIVVDAVDSHGAAVKNVSLTFPSSAATVASSSATTAIAAGPGTTGIVAACTPPACNPNLFPVFSNVFTVHVNGTSGNTVYAASTSGKSLVPITSDAAGTAITLPSQPNSIRWDSVGAKLYLGSSGGLIIVTPGSTAAPAQATSVLGKILTISPDNSNVVTSDTSTGTVYFYSTSSGAVSTLSIPGATQAAFSPDTSKAFILAGNTLYAVSPNAPLRAIALGSTGTDVKFAAAGWFAYVIQGGAVTARATCDSSLRDTVGVGGAPTLLQAVPDGSKMLAANSPSIDVIHLTSNGAGCPPALADSLVVRDLGQGSFTANQLIVLRDSSKAFVVSPLNKLLGYDISSDAVLPPIPLAAGATATMAGATVDSTTLYVGGSDNAVHKIDVATAADTKQIPLTFTPDLVAVQPK